MHIDLKQEGEGEEQSRKQQPKNVRNQLARE